jgi:hypothetical protein
MLLRVSRVDFVVIVTEDVEMEHSKNRLKSAKNRLKSASVVDVVDDDVGVVLIPRLIDLIFFCVVY